MDAQAFSAEEYDEEIRRTLPHYDEFFSRIRTAVRAHFGDTPVDWLDIGCGTGRVAAEVLQTLPVRSFTFADASRQMLDIAESRFQNAPVPVRFLQSRAENPFGQNAYDVVTSVLVNHYLDGEERTAAYARAYDALRAGGLYLFFENYDPETAEERARLRAEWIDFQKGKGKSAQQAEEHLARWSRAYFPKKLSVLIPLLRQVGFARTEIFCRSCLQIGIFAEK